MVHHKFKVFRDNNPDLSAICHVDFFDSAPDLSEADACHIRLSCLTELAKVADPATKASMALLKEKYLKDKKNGNLRRYWDRRKLEQEAEKSQNEAIMQTAITVNRTATRVVQSAEKQVNGHLKKIDSSVFSGNWCFDSIGNLSCIASVPQSVRRSIVDLCTHVLLWNNRR